MRAESSSIALSALLIPATLLLLGCPQIFFGIPASMQEEPTFIAPGSHRSEPEFVPIWLDFETEGRSLAFRLRVDETNLEPSTGSCRRWFLFRVAREAEAARRTFCEWDDIRFYLEANAQHTLEFMFASQHEVATRVVLSPGGNIHWRLPVVTEQVGLSVNLEPGYSYTIHASEEVLNPKKALPENAPTGTRWDPDEHDPIYRIGVEVGTMTISILRDWDYHVVSELSVPLYSGTMTCQPPFCETE
jgi:hypothetical protein